MPELIIFPVLNSTYNMLCIVHSQHIIPVEGQVEMEVVGWGRPTNTPISTSTFIDANLFVCSTINIIRKYSINNTKHLNNCGKHFIIKKWGLGWNLLTILSIFLKAVSMWCPIPRLGDKPILFEIATSRLCYLSYLNLFYLSYVLGLRREASLTLHFT